MAGVQLHDGANASLADRLGNGMERVVLGTGPFARTDYCRALVQSLHRTRHATLQKVDRSGQPNQVAGVASCTSRASGGAV